MSDIESEEQNNGANRIYTLKVYIVAGQLSEEWEGKEISRKIEIRGDQTLEKLHSIIFEAFDRWERHSYEFNLGEGPHDRSEIYSPQEAKGGLEEFKDEGDTEETTLDSLGLKEGRAFGYIFDHGANWIHQIDVVSVDKTGTEGEGDEKYPRVVDRVNESPPQYPER